MDWPTALLIAVLALGAMAALAWHTRRDAIPNDGWLAQHLTRRVVVHTTDDLSLEGTLRIQSTDGLVLVAVRMLEQNVELGGDVWVPRHKIAFVQEQRGGHE